MPMSGARRARARAYEDIKCLRDSLPSYWWEEVSRVRAMIDTDAEIGWEQARHFVLAAKALAATSTDEYARAHADALRAASCRLAAIASAQQARV